MKNIIVVLIAAPIILASYKSKKEFKAAQAEYVVLQTKYIQIKSDYNWLIGRQL